MHGSTARCSEGNAVENSTTAGTCTCLCKFARDASHTQHEPLHASEARGSLQNAGHAHIGELCFQYTLSGSRLEDVLSRRIRMLFLDARAAIQAAPGVARLMAEEMGKDENWQQEQLQNFNTLAEGYLLGM